MPKDPEEQAFLRVLYLGSERYCKSVLQSERFQIVQSINTLLFVAVEPNSTAGLSGFDPILGRNIINIMIERVKSTSHQNTPIRCPIREIFDGVCKVILLSVC